MEHYSCVVSKSDLSDALIETETRICTYLESRFNFHCSLFCPTEFVQEDFSIGTRFDYEFNGVYIIHNTI